MNKLPTLEQRIAAALTSTDITSSDLATLIAEVEAAAQAADENATKAREQALDPAVVVDAAKVGAAVATATLTRDRLQAALPRLQERLKQVREQEDLAAWKAEAEESRHAASRRGRSSRISIPHVRADRLIICTACALWTERSTTSTAAARMEACARLTTARGLVIHCGLKSRPVQRAAAAVAPAATDTQSALARAMLANPDAYTDRFVVSEAAGGIIHRSA